MADFISHTRLQVEVDYVGSEGEEYFVRCCASASYHAEAGEND
jgi:hypothetical protein